MLTIELDALDKNREGAIKLRKAPVCRTVFIAGVLILWFFSLIIVIPAATSVLSAVLTSIGVLVAIALLVWYIFFNRVSSFHSPSVSKMVSSRKTEYAYKIENGSIVQSSNLGEKTWGLSQVVSSSIELGYGLIVFNTEVCYLPFHGASKSEVSAFIKKLSESTHKKSSNPNVESIGS